MLMANDTNETDRHYNGGSEVELNDDDPRTTIENFHSSTSSIQDCMEVDSSENEDDDDLDWTEEEGLNQGLSIESIQNGVDVCHEVSTTHAKSPSMSINSLTTLKKDGVSKMRNRWTKIHKLSNKTIQGWACCKKLKCFNFSNIDFLRAKMNHYLSLSYNDRRMALSDLLDSDKCFRFDGRLVCTTFLFKAFRFSGDLISSVRNGSDRSSVHNTPLSQDLNVSDYTFSSNDSCRSSEKRDSIISFLERLAESTGDLMPDVNEHHLPYFRKKEVYNEFRKEFPLLYGSKRIPHYAYFISTWKQFCFRIKVRKFRRFAKCTICEQLRTTIKEAVSKRQNTKELIRQKAEHIADIKRERLEYKKKRDNAVLHPSEYKSVIIDGADQTAFGLPHFTVKTKAQTGQAIKVKLIGALEHGSPNRLTLLTMTEEFETGANHIVETLHIVLNNHHGVLPPTLYVQLDNCSKENKNRYLFSYFEYLVFHEVFEEVIVGFLPVGHTHEDIDQAFSRTADRLCSNDAITLDDMHTELRNVYNSHTIVSHMGSIANWSGLCLNEKCLTKVKGFTHYRYFRFSKKSLSSSNESAGPNLECSVKVRCTDEWKQLKITNKFESFLSFCPDIKRTPTIVTRVPENIDEVRKRLHSEEGRINSREKSSNLENLLDRIYISREEPFSWDLENAVETKSKHIDPNTSQEQVDQGVHGSVNIDEPVNDYKYDLGSFVTVRAGDSQNNVEMCTFWIGKVNHVINDTTGRIAQIEVHWYEPKNGEDAISSVYRPSYITTASGKGKVVWKSTIPSESVLVNFDSLTSSNHLPAAVKKIVLNE